jgi:transposase
MSEASPRFFSTEFKVDLVARLERGEPVARLARESGVARKLIYDWLKAYRAHGAAGLNRKRGRKVGWRVTRVTVTLYLTP